MVELQRSDIDVVATDAASPACLGDEDLLDPAATRSHALHRALRTAVEGSAAGSDELSPPVPGALSRDRGRALARPGVHSGGDRCAGQYATVDGCFPSSRAIDSMERPAVSCASSQSRSMIRTLVRVSDGEAALLQAVADAVE